jgi:hypothetical protein
VILRGVKFGTTTAGSPLGAHEGVMAKLVTVEALGRLLAAEAHFELVGGGKGGDFVIFLFNSYCMDR